MSGNRTVRVAVLVSGSGSNLQALLDARIPLLEFVLVLSSKPGVFALERAAKHGVPTAVVEPKAFATEEAFQAEVFTRLKAAAPDVICLAGYLRKLGPQIVRGFRGRILNIHPALLPKFGGPGMYGHFVHEAVLAAGEKESGCTVHVVDEEYDHGKTLAQAKVPVLPGDTAETLAQRVLEQEHQLYPETLRQFCENLPIIGCHPGESRGLS